MKRERRWRQRRRAYPSARLGRRKLGWMIDRPNIHLSSHACKRASVHECIHPSIHPPWCWKWAFGKATGVGVCLVAIAKAEGVARAGAHPPITPPPGPARTVCVQAGLYDRQFARPHTPAPTGRPNATDAWAPARPRPHLAAIGEGCIVSPCGKRQGRQAGAQNRGW